MAGLMDYTVKHAYADPNGGGELAINSTVKVLPPPPNPPTPLTVTQHSRPITRAFRQGGWASHTPATLGGTHKPS
jgi:hypothetical protein